jgi:hypothetical protein
VVTKKIGSVLNWLLRTGMLSRLTRYELAMHRNFIAQRVRAGDSVVHVVIFGVVHDIRGKNIDLRDESYLYPPPHPRSSSLLAYLYPAEYWHAVVESWLQ